MRTEPTDTGADVNMEDAGEDAADGNNMEDAADDRMDDPAFMMEPGREDSSSSKVRHIVAETQTDVSYPPFYRQWLMGSVHEEGTQT